MCSHCTTNKHRIIPIDFDSLNAARLVQLDQVIKNNTIDSALQHNKHLLQFIKKKNNRNLYRFLTLLRKRGQFLRSTDAFDMFIEYGGVARGHIIAAHVFDWWNIRTRSAGGEWPSYLVCYYGDFDSKVLPKCPPRPPRQMLECSETTHIIRNTNPPPSCPSSCAFTLF